MNQLVHFYWLWMWAGKDYHLWLMLWMSHSVPILYTFRHCIEMWQSYYYSLNFVAFWSCCLQTVAFLLIHAPGIWGCHFTHLKQPIYDKNSWFLLVARVWMYNRLISLRFGWWQGWGADWSLWYRDLISIPKFPFGRVLVLSVCTWCWLLVSDEGLLH